MTKEEHILRHKELHHYLDELVADWIGQTKALPSKNSVLYLMKWSFQQTKNPTLLNVDDEAIKIMIGD